MLTICIPTYNRARELRDRLSELTPQLNDFVNIVIIDNASSDGADQIIFDSNLVNRQIRLIRNQHNIGMAANIARCLEVAETEWLWILGDDDAVRPNAVRQIFEDIRSVSIDVDCIKYSSYCGENRADLIVNFDEVCSEKNLSYNFVANFFLISSTVLRIKKTNSLENVMSTLNSMVPHVVWIFESLLLGGKLKLSSSHLVDSTKSSTSWSPLQLEANLNLVLQFARFGNERSLKKLIIFFSGYLYFSPFRIFMHVHRCGLKCSRAYAAYMYKMILACCFVGGAPLKKTIPTIFFLMIFKCRLDLLLPHIFRMVGAKYSLRYKNFIS